MKSRGGDGSSGTVTRKSPCVIVHAARFIVSSVRFDGERSRLLPRLRGWYRGGLVSRAWQLGEALFCLFLSSFFRPYLRESGCL